VNTSLQANVDASEAILSAVPVGKLFKPLKTAIGKHAKKLNPLVKRLDVLHAKTNKATRNMTASAKKARKARDTLAEVRGRIADTQRALDAATTASKRRELQQQLTGLKKTERSAKRVATILSADHQADIRELRRIKAEEEKLARKVDQILKKIRRLDAEVLKLKKQVREAIDKRVAVVRPDWAREAVEGFVDDIDAKINGPLKIVSSKLRKLSSDELLKILKKGTATSSVVQLLKSTYTESVRQITHVKVPVWEADITVSFDQEGRPTVADNSHGRWVFTVLTAPTIQTS
jgi:predicted  nucleic acid-binding Zn-ribbon protein